MSFLILNIYLPFWIRISSLNWFRPGSNRGSFACKANVITTTLRNLAIETARVVFEVMYYLIYRKSRYWCISTLYRAESFGVEVETPQFSREKLGEESLPRKKIFSSSHTYMYTHMMHGACTYMCIGMCICMCTRIHKNRTSV